MRRSLKPTWWGCPARNTRSRNCAVPAAVPRTAELDLSVVYPTLGLLAVEIGGQELRTAGCRALNQMKADMFDRPTTVVATIPMHTPAEAIAELEYSVGELGLRAVMMASYVRRPVAAIYGFHLKPPATLTGSTLTASTVNTTTTRYGRNARGNSESRHLSFGGLRMGQPRHAVELYP